jgi:hypothetical protein
LPTPFRELRARVKPARSSFGKLPFNLDWRDVSMNGGWLGDEQPISWLETMVY